MHAATRYFTTQLRGNGGSGLRGRYARASKIEKGAILNEFVALSGYNGKYATRLLGNAASPDPVPPTKSTYRIYDEAVKESFPDHDGKAPPTESSQSLALGLLSKTPSADTGHVGINVEFQ